MSRPAASSEDLRRWRKLIREANRAADDIRATLGDLDRAAVAAKRAIIPAGEVHASNRFVQLQRMAWRFVRETSTGRLQLAPELAELAAACASAMPARAPDRKPPVLTGRRPFYLEPEED